MGLTRREVEVPFLVSAFLGAQFEGGRHKRRVDQIGLLESGRSPDEDR